MIERLTDCQMTMHGETTEDASIWTVFGRVCVAFGTWPCWESVFVGLARGGVDQPVYAAVHLTWPLPSPGQTLVFYVPGFSVKSDSTSWQVDFALWLFQFTLTFNKAVRC